MRLYEHGGDIYSDSHKGITLDFSVNLNPLGMPAGVKHALLQHFDGFSQYPDRYCRELTAAIARHEDVPAEYILCGNGAADLIYRLCFGLKPKTALVCAPTFSDYERAVMLSGGKTKYHRLMENENFAVTGRILNDIDDDLDMVFICNPNNPTGQLVSSGMLEEIAVKCEKAGVLLMVDECFLDFTPAGSAKQLMDKLHNIIILKAFTKSYSMAGLRLGYMMTRNRSTLSAAREYAQPWSVSAPAQLAGIAALNASGMLHEARGLVARERKFLADALNGLGITAYPSDANFILLKSRQPLYHLLLRLGILVRSCANYEGLNENFTRICVKNHDENEKLIAAIKEVTA